MKAFVFATALLAASVGFGKSPNAVYEVPGFEETDLSMYDLYSLKLEINGDQVSIDYSLPLELTGAKNRIRAVGTLVDKNTAILKGPHSDLTCNLAAKKCDVRYNDLTIDHSLVKEILQSQNLQPSEVQTRLEITRKFSGDPIGVIYLFKN